jgi:signal transduction histidine kinase
MLAGAWWSLEGRPPDGSAWATLAATGLAAAFFYLQLASLSRRSDVADRLRVEDATAEGAARERAEIARRLHVVLDGSLREIRASHRRALEGGAEDALAEARRTTRIALDELRLFVACLGDEVLSAERLEALLRRRLSWRCAAAGVSVALFVEPGEEATAQAQAYRLAKLVDEAASDALRGGDARALRVEIRLGAAPVVAITHGSAVTTDAEQPRSGDDARGRGEGHDV